MRGHGREFASGSFISSQKPEGKNDPGSLGAGPPEGEVSEGEVPGEAVAAARPPLPRAGPSRISAKSL